MLGASVLKLVKFLLSGVSATGAEWAILAVGCVVSFVVSLLVIKGLMEYVASTALRYSACTASFWGCWFWVILPSKPCMHKNYIRENKK